MNEERNGLLGGAVGEEPREEHELGTVGGGCGRGTMERTRTRNGTGCWEGAVGEEPHQLQTEPAETASDNGSGCGYAYAAHNPEGRSSTIAQPWVVWA